MGHDIQIGAINGGVSAIGDKNQVSGWMTSYASVDVDGLRRELAILATELATQPASPTVLEAQTYVRHLDKAIATKASPTEVRTIWGRLARAAAGLAVAANISQIGSFIEPFLG